MDNVDGSDHYATESKEPPLSLLNIVVDTNPHAWALLKDTLPLSKVIANLEVFINAHLAFNYANRVTVIASHLQKAEFLYPPRRDGDHRARRQTQEDRDVEMTMETNGARKGKAVRDYANFYRPFADIKLSLDSSLASLMQETQVATVEDVFSTSLAGALSLALMYTNKLQTRMDDQGTGGIISSMAPKDSSSMNQSTTVSARILVISVSSTSASQYIPLMNTVFAAQRLHMPIDVLSIPLTSNDSLKSAGTTAESSASFLQQAVDATSGIFMPLSNPHGLLQTLLMAYLPSGPSREMLIMPTTQGVDFRAACFCHQNTVDIGFVCSICLSIFCGPPEDGLCLTCGMPLKTGGEGWAKKPAVLPKRKKKKRKREEGGGTGSERADTPIA